MIYEEEKDLLTANEMYQMHDDSEYGFTPAKRSKHVRQLCRSICFHTFLLVNVLSVITIGFALNILHEDEDHKSGDLEYDALLKLSLFLLGFAVIFIIRIILRVILIYKWKNIKLDPTMTESKI